jgi:hypothetical protein
MNDQRYEQFVGFLRKTSEDIRVEARALLKDPQRLIEDLKDPEKQQRVKESLRELGTWARHTAEDVADIVEKAVKKAEGALNDAAKRVGVKVPGGRTSEPEWTPRAHEASPVVATEQAPEPSEQANMGSARKGPSRKPVSKSHGPRGKKKTPTRRK